jgi:transcriptional regulator with XRE-family HTH domain
VLTGRGLAELLAAHGLSGFRLARRTGLARATVHKAIHGRPVSLDTLVRIAAALDVPLGRLSPMAAELVR